MFWRVTKDRLRDVILSIMDAADEIRSKENIDNLDYGQLLAYAEVLSIIRDSCDPDDLQELGLSFDIDKRYL